MNKKLFKKYGKEMAVMVFKHHYGDNFLKWHFTSVGMHEGRQGCADFNVKAFMDACPKKSARPSVTTMIFYKYYAENSSDAQILDILETKSLE